MLVSKQVSKHTLKTKVLRGSCVGLYEEMSFKPISYPRLMEAERSRAGSEFQTTGTTTWKLRWSN